MALSVHDICQLSDLCFTWATNLTLNCEALRRCFDYLAMLLSEYYIAKTWWPREDTMKQTNILSIETISIFEFDCVTSHGQTQNIAVLADVNRSWPRQGIFTGLELFSKNLIEF